MRTYETVIVTVPTLSEDEERGLIAAFEQVIRERGGEIHATDRMGRRKLAYPIRKLEEGSYTRLLYDAGSEVPRELERRIRIHEHVLRHLTVRLERDWAAAAKEEARRDAQARAAELARRQAETFPGTPEAEAPDSTAETAADRGAEPEPQGPQRPGREGGVDPREEGR